MRGFPFLLDNKGGKKSIKTRFNHVLPSVRGAAVVVPNRYSIPETLGEEFSSSFGCDKGTRIKQGMRGIGNVPY